MATYDALDSESSLSASEPATPLPYSPVPPVPNGLAQHIGAGAGDPPQQTAAVPPAPAPTVPAWSVATPQNEAPPQSHIRAIQPPPGVAPGVIAANNNLSFGGFFDAIPAPPMGASTQAPPRAANFGQELDDIFAAASDLGPVVQPQQPQPQPQQPYPQVQHQPQQQPQYQQPPQQQFQQPQYQPPPQQQFQPQPQQQFQPQPQPQFQAQYQPQAVPTPQPAPQQQQPSFTPAAQAPAYTPAQPPAQQPPRPAAQPPAQSRPYAPAPVPYAYGRQANETSSDEALARMLQQEEEAAAKQHREEQERRDMEFARQLQEQEERNPRTQQQPQPHGLANGPTTVRPSPLGGPQPPTPAPFDIPSDTRLARCWACGTVVGAPAGTPGFTCGNCGTQNNLAPPGYPMAVPYGPNGAPPVPPSVYGMQQPPPTQFQGGYNAPFNGAAAR